MAHVVACPACGAAVPPVPGPLGPECPACGRLLAGGQAATQGADQAAASAAPPAGGRTSRGAGPGPDPWGWPEQGQAAPGGATSTRAPGGPPAADAAPDPAGPTPTLPAPADDAGPSSPEEVAKARSRAWLALVLSIVGVIVSPLALVLGPIAVVLAVRARGTLLPGTPGRGAATAAIWVTVVGFVLTVVLAAVVFLLVARLGGADMEATFVRDADGQGGVYTVTDWDGPAATWVDLRVDVGGTGLCTLPPPQQPVGPGDQVDCRAVVVRDGGTIQFVHVPTGQVVLQHTP